MNKFKFIKKKNLNIFSLFLFIFFCFYIFNLLHTKNSINSFNFFLLTLLSHLFFLIIIPLEALFYVKLTHITFNPFLFILMLSFFAEIGLIVNYYIGKNISTNFLMSFLGKRKFNKYKKSYDRYGVYVLFISSATPFLPAPIFSLIEGSFREDVRRTIFVCYLGLIVKWTLFFILFKYGIEF